MEKKKEVIHFYHTTFNGTINIKKINSKKIQIRSPFWQIENGDFQQQQWEEVFQHIIESSIQTLILSGNYFPSIIKSILNVSFTNLKSLLLCGNKIQNIEALTYINCQNLTFLSLTENLINTIKCFKKISMPNMQRIWIGINPLFEINALTRLNNQIQTLQQLNLTAYINILDHNQELEQSITYQQIQLGQDLSHIVKLNSRQVQMICKILINQGIEPQNRIIQSKIQKMIKQRFGLSFQFTDFMLY